MVIYNLSRITTSKRPTPRQLFVKTCLDNVKLPILTLKQFKMFQMLTYPFNYGPERKHTIVY